MHLLHFNGTNKQSKFSDQYIQMTEDFSQIVVGSPFFFSLIEVWVQKPSSVIRLNL